MAEEQKEDQQSEQENGGSKPEPGTYAAGASEGEEVEYEVLTKTVIDGKLCDVGDRVQLNPEQGSTLQVQGIVTRRAETGQRRAAQAYRNDPAARGTSN